MLVTLKNARRDMARHLAEADPDRVTTAQAAELVGVFAELERLAVAGKTLYAKRASESLTWRDEGHRSVASWMASTTRSGVGDALATLETSQALAFLPETTEALRRGELSAPQLKVITAAAVDHPGAETALLESAATDGLKGLKERAARVRAASNSAREEKARYLAIHAGRYVRHWSDPDGAFRLDARLAPLDGAKVLSVLGAEADARFDAARKSATHESPAAYRADALVGLLTGDVVSCISASSSGAKSERPTRSKPPATVCVMVDADALVRGHVEDGETCEVAGVGPVPVAAVRSQLSDAFVKILVHHGVDITTVCHPGRTVPAHLQSALEARDRRCVVPGCDVAHGLENHHWDVDYAIRKSTSLAGLARVCHWHHSLLTYGGYALEGGPESWEMRGPRVVTASRPGHPSSSTRADGARVTVSPRGATPFGCVPRRVERVSNALRSPRGESAYRSTQWNRAKPKSSVR